MKWEKTALLLACAVVAGFAGGVAVGHWAWPGGDVGGAAEVEEDVTVEADEASEEGDGVVAQVGGKEFVTAVPADKVRDESEDESGEATVEEVRDEDGLTDEELAEKFKREHPEEWQRIQKRRRAMMAELKKAAERRQNFLDTVSDEYFTAEQRRTHATYAEALAARAAARERIRKAAEAEKDPDPEDLRAMNLADHVIRENAADEKRTLQEAAARSAGLAGEDVATFVEILKDIEDATNVHGFR